MNDYLSNYSYGVGMCTKPQHLTINPKTCDPLNHIWKAVNTSKHIQTHFQITSAAITNSVGQYRLLIGPHARRE